MLDDDIEDIFGVELFGKDGFVVRPIGGPAPVRPDGDLHDLLFGGHAEIVIDPSSGTTPPA